MTTNFLKRIILFSFVASTTLFFGCRDENSTAYSFFVAGHLYGDPTLDTLGIHPPFKEKIPFLNSIEHLKFGVLTGDVVRESSDERWDAVDHDLNLLKVPFYIAPGNHELIHFREHYENRIGKTYFSFTENEDLFIVLDPLLDEWSISDNQLIWLKSTLQKNNGGIKNIFVFFHQFLWWSDTNEFAKYKPNWVGYQGDTTNFWSEVVPLFEKQEVPIYFFAGDTGAYPERMSHFYHQNGNLHFIGSGMGGGKKDNFILVNISRKGEVSFELIAINGDDPAALGRLEDFPKGD